MKEVSQSRSSTKQVGYSAVAEIGDRLATLDTGRKAGVGAVPLLGGAGSPI